MKQVAERGLAPDGLAACLIGFVIGAIFVRRQKWLADPFIDLSLFRAPAFSAALAVSVVGCFFLVGTFLFTAQYLLGGFVLFGKDPVQRLCQCDKPLVRGAGQSGRVIAPVEHQAHAIQPLQQSSNSFGFLNPGLFLVRLGVLAQRGLQVLGDADVVDDQPRGLVAEDGLPWQ